jgi:hypothetical protein
MSFYYILILDYISSYFNILLIFVVYSVLKKDIYSSFVKSSKYTQVKFFPHISIYLFETEIYLSIISFPYII